MVYQYPSIAIKKTREKLYNFGQVVEQSTWQSVKSPDKTWEILNHSLGFQIPETVGDLVAEVVPSIPWVEDHFLERVGGIPLNPPPSEAYWPFNVKKANDQFKTAEQFSHTYPERFWPITAPLHSGKRNQGIRFAYGDYSDLVNLLTNDPTTRQAYLPIWFPEDLNAAIKGHRVPCTLGYHFINRNGYLHLNYYIRSCDIIRHFKNDIYLACRLVFDIQKKLPYLVKPGMFNMHITSLHCFLNEKELLKPKS